MARVIQAHAWREDGNLAFAVPDPSYRLVQGLRSYGGFLNACHARQMELERELRRGRH